MTHQAAQARTAEPEGGAKPALAIAGIAKPSRDRGLVAHVVGALGRAIIAGTVAPEQTLPTEAELGRQFAVSRTVVREATRILASKGLLETRSRRGTCVRLPEAWHLLDPAVLLWQGEAEPRDSFVRELFELRHMIEPEAAALAATRIDQAGQEALAAAYQDMVAAGEDEHAFFVADSRFHRAILHSVGNTLVLALAGVVEQALELSLRLSLQAPRGQQRSMPLHHAVLDAIRDAAPEAARIAMRKLIDDAEEDVRHALAVNAQTRVRSVRRRQDRL